MLPLSIIVLVESHWLAFSLILLWFHMFVLVRGYRFHNIIFLCLFFNHYLLSECYTSCCQNIWWCYATLHSIIIWTDKILLWLVNVMQYLRYLLSLPRYDLIDFIGPNAIIDYIVDYFTFIYTVTPCAIIFYNIYFIIGIWWNYLIIHVVIRWLLRGENVLMLIYKKVILRYSDWRCRIRRA